MDFPTNPPPWHGTHLCVYSASEQQQALSRCLASPALSSTASTRTPFLLLGWCFCRTSAALCRSAMITRYICGRWTRARWSRSSRRRLRANLRRYPLFASSPLEITCCSELKAAIFICWIWTRLRWRPILFTKMLSCKSKYRLQPFF